MAYLGFYHVIVQKTMNVAHYENSSENANPKGEQSVVSNVAICGELASCAVQDFGADEVMTEQQISVEEKEADLVNLKKALDEKEATLMERDAAIKDALAREEKVKHDYSEVLKKITALEMAMTEQQKSMEYKEAALVNLKSDLEKMEVALMGMDAVLKDALAREKKVRQDYPEVRKLIAALRMAMTAEEQKPVLERKAALLNIDDPADEIKKLLKTFVQLLKH